MTIQNMIRGLQILERNLPENDKHGYVLYAEHDIIAVTVDAENMSQEDIDALTSLGWMWDNPDAPDCWSAFT